MQGEVRPRLAPDLQAQSLMCVLSGRGPERGTNIIGGFVGATVGRGVASGVSSAMGKGFVSDAASGMAGGAAAGVTGDFGWTICSVP